MYEWERCRLAAGLDVRGEWEKPKSMYVHTHVLPLRSTILQGRMPGLPALEAVFPYLRAQLHLSMGSVQDWSRDLTDIVSSFLVPISASYFSKGGPALCLGGVDPVHAAIDFPKTTRSNVETITSSVSYYGGTLRFSLNVHVLRLQKTKLSFVVAADQIYALQVLILSVWSAWNSKFPARMMNRNYTSKANELLDWITSLTSVPRETVIPHVAGTIQPHAAGCTRVVMSILHILEERSNDGDHVSVRPYFDVESVHTD